MRIALYARVSTEEQALHGLSIDAQLAALRGYAGDQAVGEYVDAGVSARTQITKRPELQRLLRDVEAGRIDLICFTKLDRWTRNIREYYKAQDILDAHKVAWRALHEDYETETASGRLKVNIMLSVSQDEADRTSERIKAVFAEKRRKGMVPAGQVALGLRLEDGRYVPSEDAQLVREMFATYIATRSSAEVARRFGRTKGGVGYMLRNENYLAAGVIDRPTWEKTQEIRATREQRTVEPRTYLFAGLVRCPYCGAPLASTTSRGSIYYRCPRRYDGRCTGFRVTETKIDKFLTSNLLMAVEDVNLEIRRAQKKTASLPALKAKRDKLTDLYLADRIDREKYDREFDAVQKAIQDAEREPREVNTAEIKSALDAYSGLSRPAKKAFWSHLLKSITPTEDGFTFTLSCT